MWVARPTVNLWRSRCAEMGLAGLADEGASGTSSPERSGRDPVRDVESAAEGFRGDALVEPAVAPRLGVDHSTVAQVEGVGIRPWRSETVQFSTDPELEAKPDSTGLVAAWQQGKIPLTRENVRVRSG